MRSKESRIFARVGSLLVASLVSATISAQSSRPSLVIGVMIEGLSMDQIELMRDQFGKNGFNRLLTDGVTIDNLSFDANFDPAAAATVIYSGTDPAVNGIARSTYYDTALRQNLSIFHDQATIGTATDLTLSPKTLLVSTIADEVRVNSDGIGNVHSIALTPEMALVMSAHAGNSAVWINDLNGAWATSSYYKDYPTVTQQRNHFSPLATKLDTLAWCPSVDISTYPDIPGHRKIYPWRVTFPAKDINRYRSFIKSAPANREVTTLATDYIKTFSLGQRGEIDMLNVAYTVAPYPYGKDGNSRVQQIDSYLRLDRDLATLFEAVENGPGMNNTLFFIAGTPAPTTARRDDERWGIPYGEFSVKRAQSLLNAYLMAKYGNGEWVAGFRDGEIYLNRQLIAQRGLDLSEVRGESAAFIAKMAGVTAASTIDDILAGKTPDQGFTARRNVALPTAADIYIALAPGWETVEINNTPTSRHMVTRASATTAPCFLLYPQLKQTRIYNPVDAKALAPTVSGILRIRSPNGAAYPPIPLR